MAILKGGVDDYVGSYNFDSCVRFGSSIDVAIISAASMIRRALLIQLVVETRLSIPIEYIARNSFPSIVFTYYATDSMARELFSARVLV